jgi:hypothetical protein
VFHCERFANAPAVTHDHTLDAIGLYTSRAK